MARRITSVSADGTDIWMNSNGVLTEATDNVLCSRIAAAVRAAGGAHGDMIDHGLSVLAQLRRQGFGVIYLGEPEGNSGVKESDRG